MKTLTPRQTKFVAAYARCGVAERAAIEAGYSQRTARGSATRLLANAGVRAELDRLATAADARDIADLIERRHWWTSVMRDAQRDMKDRLRASELLGKSFGDFLDRHDHTSSDGSMTPAPSVVRFVPYGGDD